MYYLSENGSKRGPFTINQVRAMWNAGTINQLTMFSTEGDPTLRPLKLMIDEIEAPGTGASTGAVQTIQATSKKWKVIKLVSFVMMFSAIPFCFVGAVVFGVILFAVGLTATIAASLGAWWENG